MIGGKCYHEDVKERLRQALSRRQKSCITDATRAPSAVLVPITYKDGEYHILFTRRTQTVQYHKGQISFPGGAYEERDGTLLNTALRECTEEVGLAVDTGDVLGELDEVFTVTSGYIISPYVALVGESCAFKIDPSETAEVLEVPISVLLDKSCRRQTTQMVRDQQVTVDCYYYQGNIIWGATARILEQFLEILGGVMDGGER